MRDCVEIVIEESEKAYNEGFNAGLEAAAKIVETCIEATLNGASYSLIPKEDTDAKNGTAYVAAIREMKKEVDDDLQISSDC